MAFISVKNARVGNVNAKGFTLVESYKSNTGETQTKYYKVWTDEKYSEGETINVSGILSVRLNEYEGEARAEIHINKPRIELCYPPTAPAVVKDDAPF